MRKGTPAELAKWLIGQPAEKIFEVKEWKQRRSLPQNDFYWKVVTVIADKKRVPKAEIHNWLLRRYGRDYEPMGDGKRVYGFFPDTDETDRRMLAAQTYHMRPTTKIRESDGCRAWVMLMPSHEMDTAQMSVLISGALQEAEQLDLMDELL